MKDAVFFRSVAKEPIKGKTIPRKGRIHGVIECKNHCYHQWGKEENKIEDDEDGESSTIFP
jgi:hypothetical protein